VGIPADEDDEFLSDGEEGDEDVEEVALDDEDEGEEENDGSDDDEEDEEEGDDDDGSASDEEEDEASASEDVDADGTDGEDEEEEEDVAILRRGSSKAKAEGSDDDEDDEEDEEDGGADSDATSSADGSVDGPAASRPPRAFVERYLSEALTDPVAASAARAAANASYAPLPDATRLNPAAIGAAAEPGTVRGLQATATEAVVPLAAKALADLLPAASSSSSSSSSSQQLSPALLVPPPMDLVAAGVKAKLAAVWMDTYGKEPAAALLAVGVSAKALAGRGAAAPRGSGAAASASSSSSSAPLPLPFTPLQSALWPAVSSYSDVYFAARTHLNARELRTLAALHVVNHVVTARDLVTAHDRAIREAHVAIRAARLAAAAARAEKGDKKERKKALALAAAAAAGAGASANGAAAAAAASAAPEPAPARVEVPEHRDQGYTRPRVLVLLPFRHSALQFVRTLLRLLPGRQVANRGRFFGEFTEEGSGLGPDATDGADKDGKDDEEDDEDEDEEPSSRPVTAARALSFLSKARRQMLSEDELDDENDDDDDEDEGEDEDDEDAARDRDGSGGAGSGGGAASGSRKRSAAAAAASSSTSTSYPFASQRQGWPNGLRERVREELREARRRKAADSDDSDDDSDGGGGRRRGGKSASHRGKRRRKVDRLTRDAAKMAGESILGSTAAIEAAKKAEEKARRKAAKARAAALRNPPPADFTRLLAGNIDDDFRVGIAVSRKSVRLYAPFYDADILVASPLGLRRILGGEGDRVRETDFLSSIEVVVVDGADVLLHQNWAHVTDIFEALNARPAKPGDTDFSRVRETDLAGCSRFLRQTLLFSSYPDPEPSALLRRMCHNTRGGLVVRPTYAGSITKVIPAIRQTFTRVPTASLAEADEARLSFFTQKLLPGLAAGTDPDGGDDGVTGSAARTVIYAPTYFDYVRLRNALDARELEFVTLSEYSEDKDVSRARNRFAAGHSPILLVSERFHYFRRLRVRGIRHLLFYGPPVEPHFFSEFVNWVEGGGAGGGVGAGGEGGGGAGSDGPASISTHCLFTRYDAPALERLVGTTRCEKMLADGAKASFVFV
jgi:hypothetical protein